jgi:hypothetical protein
VVGGTAGDWAAIGPVTAVVEGDTGLPTGTAGWASGVGALLPAFAAAAGDAALGGNAAGDGLPLAGNWLPPWLPWGVLVVLLLRAGLLLAACRALEKSWPPTPWLLESEAVLGLNWVESLLG